MEKPPWKTPRPFFAEETSVRRVFLRLIAKVREHMGQLTGYKTMKGMSPPWPDWRARIHVTKLGQ